MKHKLNEEAVSPVIGVIFMVVITVIIAAVMAVFAFGIGAPETAPETKLRFVAVNGTPDGGTFKIYHDGGDTLIANNTKITIRDGISDLEIAYDGSTNITAMNLYQFTGFETIVAGNMYSNTSMSAPAIGDMLRVVVMDVPTGQLIADTMVTVQ